MAVPVLHPTRVHDESFAGVTYHSEGELVPALHIELQQGSVYFEHHVLLWKHPQLDVGVRAMKGAMKRMFAGLPVFPHRDTRRRSHRVQSRRCGADCAYAPVRVDSRSTCASTTPGRDGASRLHVPNRVRRVEHAVWRKRFLIDTFTAGPTDGIVWLHGYGNVFSVESAPGEQIDIETGGIEFYKEQPVRMETQFQRLATGFLASAGQIFWNRFTGPGPCRRAIDVLPPACGDRLVHHPDRDRRRRRRVTGRDAWGGDKRGARG